MDCRIGVIGASGHYAYALECIREIEGAVLCAVAPGREDEDTAPLTSSELFVEHSASSYGDYRHMLDDTPLDVVVVNPYYFLHAEVTAECLSRGISVFCEKPLALDMESLALVVKSWKESKARLGAIFDFRYDPGFYTAKKLVESGAIGRPLMGFSQKSYKLGQRPWFYESRETFGGIIPWVGIHAVDWFTYVSGLKYTAVTAYHNNLCALQWPGMEDSAGCLFELDSGGVAVMSFDYLRPTGADSHADDRLRLVGSEGVLEISSRTGLLLTDSKGESQVEPQYPKYGMLHDFVESVMNDKHKPLQVAADAMRATAVCLIARDSADQHTRKTMDKGELDWLE